MLWVWISLWTKYEYYGEQTVNCSLRSNSGVFSPWPIGHMRPRMSMNVAQDKRVDLFKTLLDFFCFR